MELRKPIGDLVNLYFNANTKDERDKIYLEYVHKYNRYIEFHNAFKRYHKRLENENKTYCYMLTFTLKDEIKEDKFDEVNHYIISQSQRDALQVKNCWLVKEFHKSGKPHWHMSIETHKCLKKSRFKYYQNKYGNVDISKSRVKDLHESINYMSKSEVPYQLVSNNKSVLEDLTNTDK